MENYFFKLLKDDGAILAVHSATHRELRAVWTQIARLARRPDMIGGRIVVTDQSGEMVILVGAATARSYPVESRDAKAAATPGHSALSGQARPAKGRLFAQGVSAERRAGRFRQEGSNGRQ
ncbi:hypothetical protein QM467_17040 [Rhodoblastus sp. 17X3]|uniref:hypothetical protein n=1 Tax=Rhodoblastus sp. 17X3 TaxID=3047026 RepID=UPI0024B67897|nr:hypothetical protein [Rhodoblastus sp. 17X3]MDI9849753.1 hypothetical protein [Rhodoblastus sp. 17X3]